MVTQDSKNRFSALNEQITGLGLKIGAPIIALTVIYLCVILFGKNIRDMGHMSAADRAYMLNGVKIAGIALRWSSAVVVASLIFRFFLEEVIGLSLTVGGLLIFFGIPAMFQGGEALKSRDAQMVAAQALSHICAAGLIVLIPGLSMVLRDGILRIWRGISDKRVVEHRRDFLAGRGKRGSYKLINNCWDMSHCRDFVRNVCPAYLKRKNCWRMKSGCYCDETTILKSMAGEATDNEHYRGFMEALTANSSSAKLKGNAKAKRARCRRCVIYTDHQREKYRIAAPMVFPAVGLVFYLYNKEIGSVVKAGVTSADRFFAFIAKGTGTPYNAAVGAGAVTTIAMVWLAILAICYGLRAVEYLIFDLQV